MVFKRRNPRGWTQTLIESVYPRGGWLRAIQYVKHRLHRLPDTPHKIARGIWAGVLLSCTPLFGFHLIGAMLIAWMLRGNILAAVIATFYGNPVTYLPLCLIGLELGNVILGRPAGNLGLSFLADQFAAASHDIWVNLRAVFTPEPTHWGGMFRFFHEIFWPCLVGGIVAGAVQATVCYYLTIPAVSYYQNLRRSRLMKRIAERRRQAADAKETRTGISRQAGE